MLQKLSKLKPRERVALVLAGVVVFAWLVNIVVVRSTVGRVQSLERAIALNGKSLDRGRRIAEKGRKVAPAFEKKSELIEEVPSRERALNDIKGQVDDMLTRFGIDVYKNLDASEPVEAEFYTEFFVEIEGFETDVDHLLRLLDAIHDAGSSPGMLRVVELTVTPNKESGLVKGTLVVSKVATVSELPDESTENTDADSG